MTTCGVGGDIKKFVKKAGKSVKKTFTEPGSGKKEGKVELKIKNNINQDIHVDIQTITDPLSRTIKQGETSTENLVARRGWKSVTVKTADGKREGSAGPLCGMMKTFVHMRNNKEFEYYVDCKESQTPSAGDFLEVFLPSQGNYKSRKGMEPIQDTGSNLIVVKRIEGREY